ncbi:DUF2125 domain-containing protein [Paracoccus benzoatiresistens]|uniref:DUF2125 domain-containing protein n=1 Tax=Paracoccus benzoatiresistens TaxID=2997341 RepID=A0ABT4J4R9_9RHOB|nr:DUF2125 domain-containing protein [Paracoccus sp. EF6]MCZ0961373.1 DUF2125 domain-containing protein [Paracoccus sp. EF6]
MFRFAATSALALCIGAAPVLADVTPAQVWENLQKTYAGYGYEVTGKTEDAGGTLTVTDAVFSTKIEDGATTITIPQLTFQETGDARVRMSIGGDVALDSTFMVPAPTEEDAAAKGAEGTEAETPPAEPEMVEMTMTGTVKVPGNETVVSGTPEDMLYEFTYPSIAFDLTMPVDPESGATMPVTGSLTDVAGTQRHATGEGSETSFDIKASEATMQIAADAPADAEGTGGKVNLQARLTGLSSTGATRTPAQSFDLGTQLSEALAAGLDFQGNFGFETAKADFDFAGKDEAGADQTGRGTATLGTGNAALQMSEQGLGYKGEVARTNVEMTVSSLPFPISYATDRTFFDMLIPVSKAEAAQPFKFAYALEGLTFAEGIWNLFDPNKQLPRNPASLSIDLSGDAVVTQNLFDPAVAQPDGTTAPDAPFTPRTLTVNKVALDAVGAKADISGALEFGDNPNEPVGKLNGTFEGVNGLLDKLVAMGLAPEEQMMGMRMMLAMFAKPDEANPDRLTSEIEFREGGQIFANGQQVK